MSIFKVQEKTDKCEVLQELIDCGKISAKQAKSIQKSLGMLPFLAFER